jgi:Lon-like protease
VTDAPATAPTVGSSPGRRRHVPRSIIVFSLVTTVGLLAALFFVRVDYFSEWPGRVFEVTPLVRVEDGRSFDANGTVGFPTVSRSSSRLTLIEYLRGLVDDQIELLPAEDVLPSGVTPQQLRDFNLQLMNDSKRLAPAVALEHLGYDVIHEDGAQIARVRSGTPADSKLIAGDTIVAVDGQPVTTSAEAIAALSARRPGDAVVLRISPASGDERDVEVVLGAHPDDDQRAFLGVELGTRTRYEPFPFDIELQSGDVGGPSAGLAYTLEIIDLLTPGELTGDHKVAATGVITEDGGVEEIGGVAHKARAVSRAGFEVFLVPTANFADAEAAAGDDLKVIGVENLDDALTKLASLGGNGLALGQPGKVN